MVRRLIVKPDLNDILFRDRRVINNFYLIVMVEHNPNRVNNTL